MSLRNRLSANRFQSYCYGYPHKTAYRRLDPPTDLNTVWAEEDTSAVFGYLHLPFCEMRCGFCNLFTTANPKQDVVQRYLRALRREAATIRETLPGLQAARIAVGGGTPTFLETVELQQVLDVLRDTFGFGSGVPSSIETSPATATVDRLELLSQAGVRRVSIGVQSFDDAEAHGAGRPQRRHQVEQALDAIRDAGPPELNIDLMYGLDGQTAQSWLATLRRALSWQPEEVFCYPLYVRALTGLAHLDRQRAQRDWDQARLQHYQLARDLLREHGYRQTSMRRFTRLTSEATDPEYSCQADAMVGLGCGARSYTRGLHYSREYAVGRTGVRAIIEQYCDTSDFTVVEHGFRLSGAEQQRRYLLQSLLHVDGLDDDAFRARFGLSAQQAVTGLEDLVDAGLAGWQGRTLTLTDDGLALSDAIGPWLHSPQVAELSREYQWS